MQYHVPFKRRSKHIQDILTKRRAKNKLASKTRKKNNKKKR